MLLIIAITLSCAIFSASNIYANLPVGVTFFPDTLLPDSAKIKADSLSISINDSLKPKNKSFLDTQVSYQANDSMRFSVKEQKMYLYDSASVDYEKMKLSANYIEIDLKSTILYATGSADSTEEKKGKPIFKDGEQQFSSETMRYNFKTKKGKITEAITQEGDGYIHGKEVKKYDDEIIYIKNGKYTTCNLPEPHFHINASKLKIIKNNKIVTGPANLMVENVPTPLAIPFGFFPNKKGQSSGIVMPGYGQSPGLGFYLTNGGYYFALNDYMELRLVGDIYSRGSWKLNPDFNYKKRYKYSGGLNVSYSEIIRGEKDFPDFSKSTNFFVKWRHAQDPKARPNSTFSADVNAGSSNNFTNNITSNTQDYLTNSFQSNISYSKTFANSPFNFTVNGRHSQNTRDSSVSITLPEATFTMSRIYPFKRKVLVGKKKWYEQVGLSFTTNARNEVKVREDSLFRPSTLDQMRNGVRHNIPLNTSFKLFKYFTLNPSVQYSEVWYLESIRKNYDTETNMIDTDTIDGFARFGQASFNSQLSTKLYGMYSFKGEKVQAIRHVAIPSVGFSMKPDYSDPKYGYFFFVQSDSTGNDSLQYSIFDNGIYGKPSANESGVLTFNLQNNLEMKVGSEKDTVTGTKKIKIFEALNINSSYNIFADSLNWAPIGLNARTTLFNALNLNASATLDPYAIDTAGNKISQSVYKQNGKLGRLTNANFAVGFTLQSKRGNTGPKTSDIATEGELEQINNNLDAYVDFNVPWSLTVNYNINYSKPAFEETVTNSLGFNGDVLLTEKWKIGFRSGYDFEAKEITYSSFDIYRDLHCWELRFNVVPFGQQQRFQLDIQVKAPVLQDLKLTRKRNWYDYR